MATVKPVNDDWKAELVQRNYQRRRREMFHLNPTHSDQIAKPVQDDYRQAAADYRLATQRNNEKSGTAASIKIGLVVSIVLALIFIFSGVGVF